MTDRAILAKTRGRKSPHYFSLTDGVRVVAQDILFLDASSITLRVGGTVCYFPLNRIEDCGPLAQLPVKAA